MKRSKPIDSVISIDAIRIEDLVNDLDGLGLEDQVGKDVATLKEDIASNGLYHPIVVEKTEDSPYRYNLLHGLRRFLAVRENGWESIRAVVLPYDHNHARKISLARTVDEFVQGEFDDFTLAKEAWCLREDHDLAPAVLADRLRRSRGYICNLVRWLETLPEPIREAWSKHEPEITQSRLEKYSQLDPLLAIESWQKDRDKRDGAWKPGVSLTRARPKRRASKDQLLELLEDIKGSKLIYPVKKIAIEIVRFALGLVDSVNVDHLPLRLRRKERKT